MPTKPIILCLSGHDPTGGAGIMADSEAIAAHGCHAVTMITALTQQNTQNVQKIVPVPVDFLQEQLDCLLQDIQISAIKVGLLAEPATAQWIGKIAARFPALPLVIDPILWAGGGATLGSAELIEAYRQYLLPHTTVLTPNVREFKALTPINCKAVLVTGADVDAASPNVINTLYLPNKAPITYSWPRLPNTYHGSGCTLAASIAAFLGLGLSIESAVEKAQTYTYSTLQKAYPIGKGQWIPNRNAHV